jgi:hypothetical protein
MFELRSCQCVGRFSLRILSDSPENPGNLKAICKTNGDEIQTSIRDVCGDDAKDALNYYAGVCKDAGYEVGAYSSHTQYTSRELIETLIDISSSSTTTSSQTSTKTSDTESSTSGSATSTDGASSTSGSDSDSDSNSGSASASTTDSADTATPTNGGSTDKQVSAAAFAAVVFLGFAATL